MNCQESGTVYLTALEYVFEEEKDIAMDYTWDKPISAAELLIKAHPYFPQDKFYEIKAGTAEMARR